MNAVDYGVLQIELLRAIFDLVANSSLLLINSSINTSDIWNVTYSATSFGYWVAKSFIGIGGAFDVGRQNVTTLANYSSLINFLGKNGTQIFGDPSGTRGLSAVIKNASMLVNENLAVSFSKALNNGLRLVGKMLAGVNTSIV